MIGALKEQHNPEFFKKMLIRENRLEKQVYKIWENVREERKIHFKISRLNKNNQSSE